MEALERYTTGLLTELPNKNCDTMAQAVPGTSEQRWQEFLTNMPWVEEALEEAKGELGWDQDQGRLWPGFHRHAVTVMLAYSFLVWLELRQRHAHRRRGRPRDPFSLSTGSVADPTASNPS